MLAFSLRKEEGRKGSWKKTAGDYKLCWSCVQLWVYHNCDPHDNSLRPCLYPHPINPPTDPERLSACLLSTYCCSVMELGTLLIPNTKENTPSIPLFSPSDTAVTQRKPGPTSKPLECHNFNRPKRK